MNQPTQLLAPLGEQPLETLHILFGESGYMSGSRGTGVVSDRRWGLLPHNAKNLRAATDGRIKRGPASEQATGAQSLSSFSAPSPGAPRCAHPRRRSEPEARRDRQSGYARAAPGSNPCARSADVAAYGFDRPDRSSSAISRRDSGTARRFSGIGMLPERQQKEASRSKALFSPNPGSAPAPVAVPD